jgi:Fic family protein
MDLLTNLVLHYNEQNDDLPPLINLAILHYQFESIHPFYDGNGRTGRILNILYLILNDLIEVPILYLSSYIIKNKADYYKLLNQTNKTGGWKDWILYILKAVEITSLQTIKKINSINALLEQTILQVQKESPKIYKKELIELLFEQPYSKIDFVVNRIHVERKAASRYLKELENIGILKSYKAGRENLYINTRLIEVLKQ